MGRGGVSAGGSGFLEGSERPEAGSPRRIRSPYAPYSIYTRETISPNALY